MKANAAITQLNDRSREIFRQIVDGYVTTGEPMGSRTLSKLSSYSLSPASIRNIMADLEDAGLLYSPHTSAGRMPTDAGLRLFVDGLLEVGDLDPEERSGIDRRCQTAGRVVEDVLHEATDALSGLSHMAGVVLAPKIDTGLKQIDFVPLAPGRVLVVIVAENGMVENRVIEVPLDLPRSSLIEAANFLNLRLGGRTLEQAKRYILDESERQKAQLDGLTAKVIETGLASWGGGGKGSALIVRGQSHLLEDVTAVEDLERIRQLFEALESKDQFLKLLDQVAAAEGVQIFIGADSNLFSLSGCSMIVAPYHDKAEQIIGAIGVIGPTRINYARIIPMVDYTAKVIGRLLG
ncbi:MAG: heat-inducible transcriptional repressor HrcA [Alphaproteobacteria bacterium RIFOXYD12_FULL_60_8]|nr:MAG: heat-inducible transcriptional repressor HrcA [Alphaproteobacteria bacterium RIFOXYD12_FULL_60_8]